MKRIRKWLGMVVAGASAAGFGANDMSGLVAVEAQTGAYYGGGYGLTVTLGTAVAGATVKYAESETGPWVERLEYTNACSKAMWYKVECTGYDTLTGSKTVTVTPKELTSDHVWLVMPSEDYVYDGTAKTPGAACGDWLDGKPIIGEGDFEVTFTDNVNAGTAKATFTGKRNYAGTVEEEFEILKAENSWTVAPGIEGWTAGQAPNAPKGAAAHGTVSVTYLPGGGTTPPSAAGSYKAVFTVAEQQNYKGLKAEVPFTVGAGTINYAADGVTGEYCGAGYGISVTVHTPASGAKVQYSENAVGPWVDDLKYVDACENRAMHFRITAAGYAAATGSRTVTIKPKKLTDDHVWVMLPSEDYVYDGTAKTPGVGFQDGAPSIIGAEDFTVAYVNNVNAGTAKAVITGKRNYAGTVEVPFEISRRVVKFTSASATKKYDGTALKSDLVTSSGDGFAPGEGFSFTVTGSLTDAGEAENGFAYAANAGTDAGNYQVTKECGKLTVTKRSVTVASGSASKQYDGTPLECKTHTVGGDGFAAGEGATVTVTGSRTEVGTAENTLKVEFKAGTKAGNYNLTVKAGTLTVTEGKIIDGGGDEPGTGEVDPDGGISKFDVDAEFDGTEHKVDAEGIRAAFSGLVGGAAVRVTFAEGETGGTWTEEAPGMRDAGERKARYRVECAGYEAYEHGLRLRVRQRDIAKATVAPIAEVEFADAAARPVPEVSDGEPSILTAEDYTVEYRDNTRPGTAKVVLEGRRNYTGTKEVAFTIKEAAPKYAVLTGSITWKLNLGSGCYTAQLKLRCTEGAECGVGNLRYLYEDRKTAGGEIKTGLWDSSARAYRGEVRVGGTTYRYASLDGGRIVRNGEEVTYGVADASQAQGVVPKGECAIELYVRDLTNPVSDVGYVTWESNGAQCTLAVSAAGGAQGMEVAEPAGLRRLAGRMALTAAPMSVKALNESLALGVVLDAGSTPYCRLTEFAVGRGGATGRIEVGKETEGGETEAGAPGANARAALLGAETLGGGFEEIGNVPVGEDGKFTFHLGEGKWKFFRVRIDAGVVVE